jgi:protein involved in polysaccharide export with SLBB domain
MLGNIGIVASLLRSTLKTVPVIGVALILGMATAGAQSESQSPEPDSSRLEAQQPAQQAVPGQPADYRLGSGDRVRITVFGQQDLTGEYLVDGKGMLAFPLVGQIRAGGLTASELEHTLVSKLKPEYLKDPKVSAVVLTYRPFYIVGEVKKPGSYAYVSGMTVINAIALAGGFTYRAREGSFYVDRAGKDGKKARLDATPDTPVQPGDIITVRERYF